MEKSKSKVCPICGKAYTGRPALDRRDSATDICPDCGAVQSMQALNMPDEDIAHVLDLIHDYESRVRES